MVAGVLQSILGPAGATPDQQKQIDDIINTINQQCGPSQKAAANNKPAAMPTLTGPSATEMAWLSGYTT
jgi:hypothetical protein